MAFLHSTETSPASISIGQQNARLGAAGLRVGGRYQQAPLAWMAPANHDPCGLSLHVLNPETKEQ